MAGSYSHLDVGWSMIENMGDAHECVEELFWLVEKYIGKDAAKMHLDNVFYPMKRGELEKDETLQFVESIMDR